MRTKYTIFKTLEFRECFWYVKWSTIRSHCLVRVCVRSFGLASALCVCVCVIVCVCVCVCVRERERERESESV